MEASCAESGAIARSRVEEVVGTPDFDLLRFVFLEDDIAASYLNAVLFMCIFCQFIFGMEKTILIRSCFGCFIRHRFLQRASFKNEF